jgi:hypothetical protein
MFADADEGVCWDWCEEHGHEHRLRKRVALVRPKFIRDIEARCDKWYAKMAEHAAACGRRFVSNITYRASAAWKDYPTHYCYSGDMGGYARLEKTGEPAQDPEALMLAQHLMDMLYGASAALWELGFTLTFDKDGKHTVFGNYPEWVTVDEE